MKMTTDEINALVAEKVAGWKRNTEDRAEQYPWIIERDGRSTLLCASLPPTFATSADAVLPLLEQYWWEAFSTSKESGVRVELWSDLTRQKEAGWAPTFPLAACIALLRSKGVDV